MLYAQSQLISFASHCLKQTGHNGDVDHSIRRNWETENNIQPLQAGQEMTLKTIDGITITAEVSKIETI